MDFEALYRSMDVSHLTVEEVEHELLIRNILYDFKTHESVKRRKLKDRMKEEKEMGLNPTALARTWRSTSDEIKITSTAIKLIHKMLKAKHDKEVRRRLRTRMIHYRVRLEHLACSADAHKYLTKINEIQFEIAEIFENFLTSSSEKKSQTEAEKEAIKDKISEVLKTVRSELDVLNETASALDIGNESEQDENREMQENEGGNEKTRNLMDKLTDYQEGKVADVDSLLKLFKEFVLDTAVDEKQRRKIEIERERARKQELAENIEQKEKLEDLLMQVTNELQNLEARQSKESASTSSEKDPKGEISKPSISDSDSESSEEEEEENKTHKLKKTKSKKKKIYFRGLSSTENSSSSSSSSSSDTSSSSSSTESSSDSEEEKKKKSRKKKDKKSKKKQHMKRIPVSDWKLKYDGKDGGKKLAEFLKEVKLRCKSEKVSDKEIFRSAIHLFTGRAKDWFIDGTECRDFRNWKELKKELKREFRPHDLDFQLEVQATNRKQARGEKFSDYFYEMQRIFQNMSEQISKKKKFDLIWRNMRHDYKNALTGAGISSLKRLKRYGRIVDENNCNLYQKPSEFVSRPRSAHVNEVVTSGRAKSKQNPNSSGNQSKSYTNGKSNTSKPKFEDQDKGGKEKERKGEEKQDGMEGTAKSTFSQIVAQYKRPPIGVCYNCRESGHHYADCPKPKDKFCRLCGFADVTTTNCPACQKNLDSSA